MEDLFRKLGAELKSNIYEIVQIETPFANFSDTTEIQSGRHLNSYRYMATDMYLICLVQAEDIPFRGLPAATYDLQASPIL